MTTTDKLKEIAKYRLNQRLSEEKCSLLYKPFEFTDIDMELDLECNKCGQKFTTSYYDFVLLKSSCAKCSLKLLLPKLEDQIDLLMKMNNLKAYEEYAMFTEDTIFLDYYIPEFKLAIELVNLNTREYPVKFRKLRNVGINVLYFTYGGYPISEEFKNPDHPYYNNLFRGVGELQSKLFNYIRE